MVNMWNFILPFCRVSKLWFSSKIKNVAILLRVLQAQLLLNGVKCGCSLYDSLKSIWGLPALAEPAVEPSKPSETGWKDRTPVSWGCSSFLLSYPNLFPVKSHFIPHKTSDTGGNGRRMVLVSVFIRHFYQLNLKDTWQVYIPKNSFPFIAVIVKWIVCPKTCLLRGVCTFLISRWRKSEEKMVFHWKTGMHSSRTERIPAVV